MKSYVGRAVGEHDLAARQTAERLLERWARQHRGHVDGVHEVEEELRFDVVMNHQPAQASAVGTEILLLDSIGLVGIDLEQSGDELADVPIHLGEQIAGRWVQRVGNTLFA